MRKAAFVLAFCTLVTACGGVSLPPKAGPEEVQLIDPNIGQAVPEGYTTIGPVRVSRPEGTPRAELILALRARAAELGADAVIFQGIRNSTQGASADADRGEELIVTGLAIYWPAPAGGSDR